jgi:hypothetical protein
MIVLLKAGAKFNQLTLANILFCKYNQISVEQIEYFLKAGLDVNEVD